MRQYNQSIKGKLFKYFEGRLRLKKSTKGWWRSDCPYCGGKFTFGVNLESARVKCFKCNQDNSPIELLMYLEGFETYMEARKFLNIQQEFEAYERLVKKEERVEKLDLSLPDSFHILGNGDSFMAKAARNYLKKRGFNISKLSLSGIGYCTDGEYAGYIVFPYYVGGKLVYFQGRRYMGVGPKMKNPNAEIYGIGKTSLIYNMDALYIYKKVYILESITNCQTLGDNAIGLSGKKVSTWQSTQILQSPCEQLVIVLDPDAMDEAYKMAMQMVHYKRVKVVRLPEEKDVNDLGRKETLNFVRSSEYLTYNQILKLKNNLNEGSKYPYQRVRPAYNSTRGVS